MTRAHHVLRLGLLGVALAAACTPAPNILPTNDLNRPTDIAFMCLGAYGQDGMDENGAPAEVSPYEVTGQPMRTCHPPAVNGDHQSQPVPSIHNRAFAFVANSASGDLSVIDADNWKIVDLNKSTGGYGRVPLGGLPEQISASTDGCRLVSSNRGSCDLTLVDPSTLLAPTLATQYNSPTVTVSEPPGNGLQRIVPHWPGGAPVASAPYETVFLPRDIHGLDGSAALCSKSAVPWRALVTFPSCDLVAVVDFPSGEIVSSAQVVQDSTTKKVTLSPIDPNAPPTCPADCGGGTDGGAPAGDTGKYAPTGIAIFPTGDHAYVSLSKQNFVMSFALAPSTSAITPMNAVELHGLSGGSNRIRLGVDPWVIQGDADNGPEYVGQFVGQALQRDYLYVIARDGSLRIIHVFNPGDENAEIECETNFDPLDPQKKSDDPTMPAEVIDVSPQNPCIPYGKVNRRQYSSDATTGLRFPAVPIDVAAADMTGDPREDTVNGGYAWVLTSSGTIYLVNITPASRSIKAVVHNSQTELFPPTSPRDPFPLSEEPFVYKNGSDSSNIVFESTPFPNRPRDRNVMSYAVSLDSALGPTRLDLPPLFLPTAPYIEPYWTQGTEDNATALDVRPQRTYVFFPDRDAAIAQGWDVTWQGTVTGPRYSGMLHLSVLTDGGGGFCSAGVLPGDIVTLRGCTTSADCPLGLTCDRDPSLDKVGGGLTVTGLCISANLQASLSTQCAPFKSTVRRYDIAQATESELTLTPHLDEVVRSSLSPCQIQGMAGTTGTGGATGTGGTGGAAGMAGTDGMGGTGGAAGMAGTDGMGGAGGSVGTGGSGGAGGMAGTGGSTGTGGTGDNHMNDCLDPADPTTQLPPATGDSLRGFSCVAYKGEPRCLNTCAQNRDCRAGRVCLPMCKPGSTPDLSGCPAGAVDCTPEGLCVTGQDLCSKGAGKSCNPGEFCTADNKCVVTSFCGDGPPLTQDACFPQLTSYVVNVNAGFLVSGSASGSFNAGTTNQAAGTPIDPMMTDNPADRLCRPFNMPSERDKRLVSRIPLRPYPGQSRDAILCEQPMHPVYPTLQTNMPFDVPGPPPAGQPPDRSGDGFFIDRFDPALEPMLDMNNPGKVADVSGIDPKQSMPMMPKTGFARPEAPQLIEWMKTWTRDVTSPNACLYMGGPIDSDTQAISSDPTTRPPIEGIQAGRPQHVRARFRNTQVAFVLAAIERAPPSGTNIHFDVHGGFRQEAVVMLSTVEVSAPARLVLGPIDSNRIDTITMKAAPFFFVVDQRRLGRGQGGGPTRGQIVRVNPYGLSSTNGFLPVYEDFHASNGLFPIQ
jgi:hypothetical protein